MSAKKNSSPKKSPTKKQKKEEEPAPDLLTKEGNILEAMIAELKVKADDLKSKRNYIQNERDLLEKFSGNVKQEIGEVKMVITNKETEAEKLEEEHRVEIKVYLQKVKHLEYDQRLEVKRTEQEGVKVLKVEEEEHEKRLQEMRKEKSGTKKLLSKTEEAQQQEVKQLEQQQKKKMKLLSEDYDKKLISKQESYEESLIKLRAELELRLKVEIHEIEERKNQHLNELIRNHEAAFAELKAYYNEITAENLGLIKAQKQRIEELQSNQIVSAKLISEIKAKNKAMEEPLEKNRKLRDDFKYALRLNEKDKMALANLKIKLKSLTEKIAKTEKEQIAIERRYTKAMTDRDNLENRFGKITNEVKTHADAKNVALSNKLAALNDKLDSKEAQLQQLIKSSKLDPAIISQVTTRIQQSIESKNRLTKNLQYSINHATKAYNDATRVYEAKLIEFGVPADELGFQTLASKTSMMPAGLVSSQ